MFAFSKGELDGKNVSILMPQPFSGRHNSYLQNYLNTEEPRILNKLQRVVALDKVCEAAEAGLYLCAISDRWHPTNVCSKHC